MACGKDSGYVSNAAPYRFWAGAGLLFSSISFSQSTFGSIRGAVRDPVSAMVPGAEVELTGEGTGAIRRTSSSSPGVFSVPNFDVGRYRVRVSGPGFTTYERSGLILTANQIINLDEQKSVKILRARNWKAPRPG